MISLKEALIQKGRRIDIDEIQKEEIWQFLIDNYVFSENSYKWVSADELKSKIEITSDGIVNAPGLSIKCVGTLLKSLTNDKFRFGECSTFICRDRYSLKSLKGAPNRITSGLFCQDCIRLESIDEDITIQSDYYLSTPDVYLEGCETLKSLKGLHIPKCNYFTIEGCETLKDLQGGPIDFCMKLNCNGCKSLKSLKGCPEKIKEYMICTRCPSLKSFKDISDKIMQIKLDEDTYDKLNSGKIKYPTEPYVLSRLMNFRKGDYDYDLSLKSKYAKYV